MTVYVFVVPVKRGALLSLRYGAIETTVTVIIISARDARCRNTVYPQTSL